MKTEQVPGEKPRSPQPEAAHIARVAHNLILSVLVATQVSFSLSPPITRVAIICGLDLRLELGHFSLPPELFHSTENRDFGFGHLPWRSPARNPTIDRAIAL